MKTNNLRVVFLAAVLPMALTAQVAPDRVPLKYWPAPLYWQPSPVLARANAAQPEAEGALSPHLISASSPLTFIGMTPCRIVDTRASQGFSGAFGPPILSGGTSRTFPLQSSSTCTIPNTALAYSLNVTVVPPGFLGFIEVFPTGAVRPLASTINDNQGAIISNAVIAEGGTGGAVDVFANNDTDLVMDINGYFVAAGSGLTSSNPLPGSAPGSIFVARNSGSNPGNSLTIQGGAPAAGSTDVAGGDLLLTAGLGTGLGGSGNVRVQTAGQNDLSGTTDNLLVDREIFVARAKQLTLSAPGFTSLMSIHLTGTHTAGGRVFYVVRATDGGSQIATEEGVIQYLATANSITCTVQTNDKLNLGTVNSGCTPGFFNPGSQPGISIFDNVTFSSPAPIVVHEVYFRIMNDSGSAIRLEP